METLLLVIGACIGIGLILGIIWGTVRYLVPTLIWGVWQIISGCVEGWRQADARVWHDLCAKNPDLPQDGPLPSGFVIAREQWRQGWRDVRAKEEARRQRQTS